ncbi:hypothetical protein LINPERPRIM_LOCUS23831 [Linum perenne]
MEWKTSERINNSSRYDSISYLLVLITISGVKYSRFGDQCSDYVSYPLPKCMSGLRPQCFIISRNKLHLTILYDTREEMHIQVCEVPITIRILLGFG